jgi:hypothetical protein
MLKHERLHNPMIVTCRPNALQNGIRVCQFLWPESVGLDPAKSFSPRPGTTCLKRRSSTRRPWFPILHCIRIACIHLAEVVHLTIHWTSPRDLRCHVSRSFPEMVGIEESEWSDNTVPPLNLDASSITRECGRLPRPRRCSIRMSSSAGFLDYKLINQA